jgi:hypothetical protein
MPGRRRPGAARPGTPERRVAARLGMAARSDRAPAGVSEEASEVLPLPVATRLAALPRRTRRRMVLMAAAVAATVSLGIGAPLAYAYGEGPSHQFGALAHYLDEDDR